MIIKRIVNYVYGYLRIVVEGYYIERFMNICRNKGYMMWNIRKNNDIKIALNIYYSTVTDFAKLLGLSGL